MLCVQMMNVVDLAAIVPFYIEYITNSGDSIEIIRILRLVRIIRVFKIGKYNEGVQLITRTVRKSIPALSLLLFFSSLGVILFGCLMYFAEQGVFTVNTEHPDGSYLRPDVLNEGQEVSPFSSILVSMYWVVVCITTVGFGDLYPTTPGGRVLACIAMYSGVLVLALPISVMGSTFQREYEKKHIEEEESDSDWDPEDREGGAEEDEDSLCSLEDTSGDTGVVVLDMNRSSSFSGRSASFSGYKRRSSPSPPPPPKLVSRRSLSRENGGGECGGGGECVCVMSTHPPMVQINVPGGEGRTVNHSSGPLGVSLSVDGNLTGSSAAAGGGTRVVGVGDCISSQERRLLVQRLAQLSAESSALLAVMSSCVDEEKT